MLSTIPRFSNHASCTSPSTRAYPITCLASSTTVISSLCSEPDEKQRRLLFIPISINDWAVATVLYDTTKICKIRPLGHRPFRLILSPRTFGTWAIPSLARDRMKSNAGCFSFQCPLDDRAVWLQCSTIQQKSAQCTFRAYVRVRMTCSFRLYNKKVPCDSLPSHGYLLVILLFPCFTAFFTPGIFTNTLEWCSLQYLLPGSVGAPHTKLSLDTGEVGDSSMNQRQRSGCFATSANVTACEPRPFASGTLLAPQVDVLLPVAFRCKRYNFPCTPSRVVPSLRAISCLDTPLPFSSIRRWVISGVHAKLILHLFFCGRKNAGK